MDLSGPLSSFMNKLDSVALRVVDRSGSELTGRQVARLAGAGTPANIRLSLLRLVAIGLVRSAPAPHATMYSANRAHILWPAVEIAMNARQELYRRISTLCSTAAPLDVTVAVYGSVARGDSTGQSDIDLLVVFPDGLELDTRDAFVTVLRDQVQLWTGNVVQIYDLTESALTQQGDDDDPIVASWVADGIVLFGENLFGMGKSVWREELNK